MDGEVIKSTSIGSTFHITCDNFAKECKESNQRKLIISFICTEIRKISITNKTAQTLGYPLVLLSRQIRIAHILMKGTSNQTMKQ